jgi:hypothetical protein
MDIRRATAADASFIARSTLNAERANNEIGMWDVFFGIGDETGGETLEDALKCLEVAVRAVDSTPKYSKVHLCYKNFFLAIDPMDGTPIGSASCYMDSISSIKHTWKALRAITQEVSTQPLSEHLVPSQ